MAKLCECCGNKNNSFVGDPLYLEDDKILCHKCIEPIRDELNQLFFVETKEEFDALTNCIIGKSKTLFNDSITNCICSVINERCGKWGFSIGETDAEKIAPITDNIQKPITNQEATSINMTLSGMFDNIGSKIKTLAQVVVWIGIIASVFSGSIVMTIDDEYVLLGFAIAIIGSLVSVSSSFVLYGFGKLIENTDILVAASKKESESRK